MSETARPETAKTKDTAAVTTRDNARARAYTAALVSAVFAPSPGTAVQNAGCGFRAARLPSAPGNSHQSSSAGGSPAASLGL